MNEIDSRHFFSRQEAPGNALIHAFGLGAMHAVPMDIERFWRQDVTSLAEEGEDFVESGETRAFDPGSCLGKAGKGGIKIAGDVGLAVIHHHIRWNQDAQAL